MERVEGEVGAAAAEGQGWLSSPDALENRAGETGLRGALALLGLVRVHVAAVAAALSLAGALAHDAREGWKIGGGNRTRQ